MFSAVLESRREPEPLLADKRRGHQWIARRSRKRGWMQINRQRTTENVNARSIWVTFVGHSQTRIGISHKATGVARRPDMSVQAEVAGRNRFVEFRRPPSVRRFGNFAARRRSRPTTYYRVITTDVQGPRPRSARFRPWAGAVIEMPKVRSIRTASSDGPRRTAPALTTGNPGAAEAAVARRT